MTYDGLERLKAVTGAVAEGFTLDAGSNLASRTGPAKTFSYDTSDRLTGDGTSTFTWDDADRLTARGADTFSYDPLARLTGSTVAGTSRTFSYNGDGLLASRTVGAGTPESLLWDPLTRLARLLQIGGEQIVCGLGPLYGVKSDGSTVAFARDGMKSVRAEVDSAGAVTKSFRYTAYGDLQTTSPTSATPSFLAYNSQLRDGSGLIYLRARWYEPAVGRFITRDPLLGEAGAPSTLNAFGYAGGNPLTMSAPTGMAFEMEDGGCSDVSACNGSASNWAYDVAAVFRDLDSTDFGTKAAALAKVAAVGLVAGVAGAGVVAGGVAAVTAVTATSGLAPVASNNAAVIGETASRVQAFASRVGAASYSRVLPPGPGRMKANMQWIDDVMDKGMTIVDIGRDPAKVRNGLDIGRYYAAELHRIADRNYQNYIRLW